MNRSKNPFVALADQAAHGDHAATNQFRHELEPEMVHIVRQTLRARLANTPMTRRILAEAARLGAQEAIDSSDRELLVRRVASHLSLSVAARLRIGSAGERVSAETVVGSNAVGPRIM